jgi:hypothetical protein
MQFEFQMTYRVICNVFKSYTLVLFCKSAVACNATAVVFENVNSSAYKLYIILIILRAMLCEGENWRAVFLPRLSYQLQIVRSLQL